MFDFDVILGMDWLASHRATIDCYARTVIFGNVRQPEFVYHVSSPLKSVKLISAMRARTLISHGCRFFWLLLWIHLWRVLILKIFLLFVNLLMFSFRSHFVFIPVHFNFRGRKFSFRGEEL